MSTEYMKMPVVNQSFAQHASHDRSSLVSVGLSMARYGHVVPWLVLNPPVEPPVGYGYGLAVVYGVSLGVILTLYPVCSWFAAVERRRRERWLSYI